MRLATAILLACALAGCGGGAESSGGKANGPNPQPAFYLTAKNADGLERRAAEAGTRFARSQGRGRAILVLDFGAARVRRGTHGVALRGGTFFSNAQVAEAIRAAGRGYARHHREGRSVDIVYVNSNAFLSRPGKGYEPFDVRLAREAGVQQARTIASLDLPKVSSVTVGGDIEPGYDVFGPPEVSIAMVAGANSASRAPYYDVGTAPCEGGKCVNGWTPDDVCQVAAGPGRRVLPEVYADDPEDQPAQWAAVQKRCGIKSFAGVSASPQEGSFAPDESWQRLREEATARVAPVIVVWPAAPK
jgi:hypothetical protein